MVILSAGLTISCSSSRSLSTQDKPRPLPQGERLYLARYNPCTCFTGEAYVSAELSPISSEDLEVLKSEASIHSSEERQSTLPHPNDISQKPQEASVTHTQRVSRDATPTTNQMSQSASIALMIYRRVARQRQNKLIWERVEMISTEVQTHGSLPQLKRSQARVYPPSRQSSESPEESLDAEASDALTEDIQRRIIEWHRVWSWWPQNPHAYLLLRVQIKEYSSMLSGHVLRKGDLRNIAVRIDL